MYSAILAGLFLAAAGLGIWGVRRGSVVRVTLGVVLGVATLVFFWFLGFWGEQLWFEALGYEDRFWKVVFTQAAMLLVGAALAFAVIWLLTWPISRSHRYPRYVAWGFAAYVGANWGLVNWETVLIYLSAVRTELADPIFGKDTGFYLFRLPFYDALYLLVWTVALVGLVAAVAAAAADAPIRITRGQIEFGRRISSEGEILQRFRPIYFSAAAFLLVVAAGRFLARYHLMYSKWGVAQGPGWTDVHVRVPGYWIVLFACVLLAAGLIAAPLYRRRITGFFGRFGLPSSQGHAAFLASAGGVLAVLWFLVLAAAPGLVQWLRVEPNELTLESPYIAHNIAFTRVGFGLDRIEGREFPAAEALTPAMVAEHERLFRNIRLWDWRVLDAVYKQFQEIRLYYEFADVDVDRYAIGDDYRQVMVSAREMEQANLPPQSQTFVNRRFKYTHGYGVTLTTVNEFTPQGLPNLLVKNIPPVSAYPSLEVDVPQIYYGELTRSYVIANSSEAEFDYPRGDQNVYIHYDGRGGVALGNLWRKFLYGWKFGGTRLFLSGYPTSESRIMFHRQILERVNLLAPFLEFDDDPYVVLAGGRLFWIIDAYTTSRYFPYSEPLMSRRMGGYAGFERGESLWNDGAESLAAVNYVRNSVKVVVDAFHGSVDFYVFEPQDPLIRVWDRVFPGLLKPAEQMPEELLVHVRYPIDLLLAQGLVYAKYHMTDPAVFYNQEDLWIRTTEKYYNQVIPVEPYYIMWEPPETDDLEFILMLPFTPKNRQVMIGWLAGMCDGENYGRLLAYQFPKDKRILGPQQVETKINQDPYLSAQLTLWDQRGSTVIRGNVLAIPVGPTLLYVEPIYLQAETAAYPELRLVAVMHNDDLSYAETFEQALRGLFEEELTAPVGPATQPQRAAPAAMDVLIRQADQAFDDYLRLMGEKKFPEASEALGRLGSALEQLTSERQPSPGPQEQE